VLAREHTISSDKLAPPGIPGKLIVVEGTSSDPTGDAAKLTDSEEREFEVSCAFAKEAGFSKSIRIDREIDSGTSFFKGRGGTENRIHTTVGVFRLFRNPQGELSCARFTCRARSLDEARELFWKGLTPPLDHLTYLANTPILIDVEYCVDPKNAAFSAGYTTPYGEVTVGIGQGLIRVEMITVYALYREAKCSLSNFYRFLCYYKIIEGVYCQIRPDLYSRARAQGIPLSASRELIPDHPDLRQYQPQYVNRSIRDLFDNEWRSEYRDAVAHFGLDSGTLLNPSQRSFRSKFADIILPVELACRVVVDQQNVLFDQYYGAGGVGVPSGT